MHLVGLVGRASAYFCVFLAGSFAWAEAMHACITSSFVSIADWPSFADEGWLHLSEACRCTVLACTTPTHTAIAVQVLFLCHRMIVLSCTCSDGEQAACAFHIHTPCAAMCTFWC